MILARIGLTLAKSMWVHASFVAHLLGFMTTYCVISIYTGPRLTLGPHSSSDCQNVIWLLSFALPFFPIAPILFNLYQILPHGLLFCHLITMLMGSLLLSCKFHWLYSLLLCWHCEFEYLLKWCAETKCGISWHWLGSSCIQGSNLVIDLAFQRTSVISWQVRQPSIPMLP